jgi:hypothetical protein
VRFPSLVVLEVAFSGPISGQPWSQSWALSLFSSPFRLHISVAVRQSWMVVGVLVVPRVKAVRVCLRFCVADLADFYLTFCKAVFSKRLFLVIVRLLIQTAVVYYVRIFFNTNCSLNNSKSLTMCSVKSNVEGAVYHFLVESVVLIGQY